MELVLDLDVDVDLDILHNQRRVAQISLAGLHKSVRQRRDDGGQGDRADVAWRNAGMLQELDQHDTVLIRHARMVCGEAPTRARPIAVIEAQRHIGVAGVNGEQHEHSPEKEESYR